MLQLIALLVAVGLFLYVVNNLIPMDRKIRTILNLVVVVAVVCFVLQAFGVLRLLDRPVPQIHK